MVAQVTINLDSDVVGALDRMVWEMRIESREWAVAAMLRECLIAAGYLPDDPDDEDIEEDTPTGHQA